MYPQFHSVKEPSKNHDIWVRFSSVRVLSHFFYFRVQVRFLEKPEFCFGSFLLGSGSFPSLMFSFINSGISSAYKLAASAVCYNRLYSLRTTIRMSAAFHNNTPSHLCAHIRPRMPGARPRKYATDEKHERDSDRCI